MFPRRILPSKTARIGAAILTALILVAGGAGTALGSGMPETGQQMTWQPAAASQISAQSPIDALTPADALGVQVIATSQFLSGASTVRNAGARFVHMGIEWRQLAPTDITPASYDWSQFDLALSLANSLGYSVVVTLGGNPCWAAQYNRGPINRVPLSRWTEYVSAVVQRYRTGVTIWAIYNEPDVVSFTRDPSHPDCMGELQAAAFGDHPAEYVQTLQAAYQAIKTVDPDATVLLGGLAYDNFVSEGGPFNPDFLDQILTRGAAIYFDVMNFHYYPEYDWRWEGITGLPGLIGKASELRRILRNHGVDRPIVCTELGDSSGGIYAGDPRTEGTQSQAVIKYFTRAIAAGIRIGIWYNMNDYVGPGDPFRNHGLLYADLTAKPSLSAFHTLADNLAGQTFIRALASNEMGASNLEGYLFWDPSRGEELRILWSRDGTNQTITLPPGVTSVVDKYGSPVVFGATLAVNTEPRLITRNLTTRQAFLPLIAK